MDTAREKKNQIQPPPGFKDKGFIEVNTPQIEHSSRALQSE